MTRRSFLAVSILVLLNSSDSPAQRHDVHFSRLLPNDGLSSGWILSFYQDHLGFMWIGTYEGLNRYDGFTVRTYASNARNPNALLKDYITGIVEDASNVLWVATTGGLHRFNRDQNNFTRVERPSYGIGMEASNKLIALVLDSHNILWLASESAGIGCFDPGTGSFTPFLHAQDDQTTISSDRIHTLRTGSDGAIWIATDRGVDRIDPASGVVERWSTRHGVRMRDRLSRVVDILNGKDGVTWFTLASGGLWKWQDTSGWVEHLPEWISSADRDRLFLSRMCLDVFGKLWIGSYYDGLLRFDPATGKFRKYINVPDDRESLVAQTVTALALDRSANLWIGTDQGVNVVDTKPAKFRHHQFHFVAGDTKRSNNIMSIIEDTTGVLWLGLEGKAGEKGLIRYDQLSGRSELVTLQSASGRRNLSNIYSMARDRSGRLWMATYGQGLCVVNPSQLSVREFIPRGGWGPRSMERIRSVAAAKDGTIWLAPRGTPLLMIDQDRNRLRSFAGMEGEPLALGASGITALYEQSNGVFWVGTQGRGVLRFDRSLEVYDGFPFDGLDSSSLSYDVVTTIFEDMRGRVWVGTTEGLNLFRPESRSFAHYAEPEGLPGAVICGILEDDIGALWISTNRGIVRLDPDASADLQLRTYDVSDGLQSLEFNRGVAWKTSKGELFFGGNNGLTSFFPQDVQDNPFAPSVVLTLFRVLNIDYPLPRAIESVGTIVVDYSQNVLEFGFAALEFTHPKNNLYSTMLEGFDSGWSPPTSSRSVTYTNLNPGTYTLRFRGSNNDGLWSEPGREVTLVVLPPFWMTGWFRGMLIGGLLAFIIALFRWRESQLRARHKVQEQFARELLHSQEQERKRIAAELHDSLGQNITLMKNAALLALQKKAVRKTVVAMLEDISATATSTLDEARRIAYNLRPYQLDRFGLSEALREMAEEVSRTSPIRWTVSISDIDTAVPKESEINVYRIVQEAINNVLKHSQARQANVRVEREGGRVNISIDDDGLGIRDEERLVPERRSGGFGLSGIRERVRILDGEFLVAARSGGGTKVTIRIPERPQHD